MSAPILVHLPEPIGWIAVTPEALREAQERARGVLGVKTTGNGAAPRAEARDCVSAEEAARALGVEPSWLLRRARMRKIPFLKVGKYCRFDIEEVRAHLVRGAT